MIRTIVAAAVFAALSAAPALADAPDITGTWAGNEQAHVKDAAEAGMFTFVVTGQDGADFDAETTYTSDGKSFTETVSGAIAPDGKSVFYANREGHAYGTLQSEETLDFCYVESGEDAHVSCVRLTRQP